MQRTISHGRPRLVCHAPHRISPLCCRIRRRGFTVNLPCQPSNPPSIASRRRRKKKTAGAESRDEEPRRCRTRCRWSPCGAGRVTGAGSSRRTSLLLRRRGRLPPPLRPPSPSPPPPCVASSYPWPPPPPLLLRGRLPPARPRPLPPPCVASSFPWPPPPFRRCVGDCGACDVM